jgi:hypothetical protein
MPVKIYFCDSCNESIPVKDLHSNRFTLVSGGRIFCPKCSPKKPKDGFRFGAGLIAGAVGFAALAGVAYVGGREIQKAVDASSTNARAVQRVETDLRRVQSDAFSREEHARLMAPLEVAAEKARQDVAALDGRLRAAEDAVRGASSRQERDATEVVHRLAEARAQAASESKRLDELARTVELLKGEIEGLKVRAAEIAARTAAPEKAAAPPPSAAPATPAPSAEEVELARWTAMLKESDPGRRYEAVNGLANLHVEGATAALEGALADPESYVRDAAIRALRRHASLRSVPKIIAALRDPDLFVRTSAKAALKQLVGVEPAFDPDADGPRRERGVREFETWWGANAEKFLNPK